MKIAVTGPNGQLGSELVRRGCLPLHTRFFSVDLLDEIDQVKPVAIINSAAYTNVDGCEDTLTIASDVNVRGVEFLSHNFDGHLVQISTDYIFDGSRGPYTPNDPPDPISIYGWSKLGGELVTRRHKGPWLIIRTTILFSESQNNFVYKVVKQLEQGKQVELYQPELKGTPTYVPSLAKEIMRMVRDGYTGVAHIAGRKNMTRLEFGRLIAKTFGFDPDGIVPIEGDIVGAPRPLKAGLISDHSEYKPVYSHSAVGGLEELAGRYKRGEIWK